MVTRVLYLIGALVATICSALFTHYTWSERVKLQELAGLPFFIPLCLLTLGTAVVAWLGFIRHQGSRTHEQDASDD